MPRPELRRRCELCRARSKWAARLHEECESVVSQYGGERVSMPEGSTLCMRCIDANPHVCVRAYPLPIARGHVHCPRCEGVGHVHLDHRTLHWRRKGDDATRVVCRVCDGKGEIPG